MDRSTPPAKIDAFQMLWPLSLAAAALAWAIGEHALAAPLLLMTMALSALSIRRVVAGVSISLAVNFWVVGSMGHLGYTDALRFGLVIGIACWVIAFCRRQLSLQLWIGHWIWLGAAAAILLLGTLTLTSLSFAWAGSPGILPVGLLAAVILGALAILGLPVSMRAVLYTLEATGTGVALIALNVIPGALYSFTVNEIWLARAVALGALSALILAKSNPVHYALAASLSAVVVLLAKDGPLLGLLTGIAVVVLRRSLAIGAPIVIACAVGITQLSGISDDNAAIRWQIWKATISAIDHSQWLTGIGLGVPSIAGFEYPHNAFLEVWLGLGAIGAICITGVVLTTVLVGRNSPYLPLFIAGFTFALASGSVGSNPEYWIFSGLVLANQAPDPLELPSSALSAGPACLVLAEEAAT